MTILDLEPLQPKINSTFFTRVTGTVSGKYWSSDPRDISNALDVNFDTGELSHAKTDPDIGDNLYVRCVRGTILIRSIFADNGDFTVIDYGTGLMWQQGESIAMLWDDALNYCEGSTLAGHLDWRLPNAKELESLICPTTGLQPCGTNNPLMNPTINTDYFPSAHSALYWSSTTCTQVASNAYSVNFSDRLSRSDIGKAVTQNYVRCVRGGY